ncbi:hypothetical protein F5Y16DRAFT_203207 [Xylariaceae sp. FL0255]|nr:hypothetical protein F5Y16DRAFT_203207 [Xylariaceae sp. FL0255]
MSLYLDIRASREFYTKLDRDAQTIRLIDVLPGNFRAPIYCELVEQALTSCPYYDALSYSWHRGDGSQDEVIICNAKPMYISANLHAALQRLRLPSGKVRLWVDAISINQSDPDERAFQVSMMRQIYENSNKVLIWLGDCGNEDDLKFGILDDAPLNTHENPNLIRWFGDQRDIPKLKLYFSSIEKQTEISDDGDDNSDIFGAFCVLHLLASGIPVDKIWHLRHYRHASKILKGLNTIMRQGWWQRIWVVQETVVTKEPIIHYGTMCAPWQMFAFAAVEFDRTRVQNSDIDGAFLNELNSGHALMQFTRIVMEIESTRRNWERREPMPPLTLLRRFRSRLATDSRDKVFAVLGLIRTWGTESSGQAMQGIRPDYTLRPEDLFFATTELLIRNTRSLAVLAGTLGHREPSWVTNWSRLPAVNEHIRLGNYQLYNAAHGLSGSVTLHGRSVLEAPGYLVDEIDYIGRELESGLGRARARNVVLGWEAILEQKSYVTGEPMEMAFWRTLCADLDFTHRVTESQYTREFSRLKPHESEVSIRYQQWRHIDESSRRRTSLIDGIWVEPTTDELQTRSKNLFQYLLECASGNRRFFRTKKGYIGTGPIDTRVGDSVAVVLGSRVPFVLRPSVDMRACSRERIHVLFSEEASYLASGTGTEVKNAVPEYCASNHEQCYFIIGDAYVHGLMGHEEEENLPSHMTKAQVGSIYLI